VMMTEHLKLLKLELLKSFKSLMNTMMITTIVGLPEMKLTIISNSTT